VQTHDVDCNWFLYQENAADLVHTVFLHGAWLRALGVPDASGFFRELCWYAYRCASFGLVKAWRYEAGEVGWGNLAVFPNILRIVQEMHWRVPLSNERTRVFQISGRRMAVGPGTANRSTGTLPTPLPAVQAEGPPIDRSTSGEGRRSLWSFQGQDAAACTSQGNRRTSERLTASDLGVALYRRAWMELCRLGYGPAETYREFLTHGGMLDPRPWLGTGDVTVSRPVDELYAERTLSWQQVFGHDQGIISVPRGATGPGPLG